VPRLRRFDTGFSHRRLWFIPLRFVMHRVELGQVFLSVIPLSSANHHSTSTPSSFIQVCDSDRREEPKCHHNLRS